MLLYYQLQTSSLNIPGNLFITASMAFCLNFNYLSLVFYITAFLICNLLALMATTTVLTVIRTAPAAGLNKMPW